MRALLWFALSCIVMATGVEPHEIAAAHELYTLRKVDASVDAKSINVINRAVHAYKNQSAIEPPIGRRFISSLVGIIIGVSLYLIGMERRNWRLSGAGMLLAILGFGLWWITQFSETWGWWWL